MILFFLGMLSHKDLTKLNWEYMSFVQVFTTPRYPMCSCKLPPQVYPLSAHVGARTVIEVTGSNLGSHVNQTEGVVTVGGVPCHTNTTDAEQHISTRSLKTLDTVYYIFVTFVIGKECYIVTCYKEVTLSCQCPYDIFFNRLLDFSWHVKR